MTQLEITIRELYDVLKQYAMSNLSASYYCLSHNKWLWVEIILKTEYSKTDIAIISTTETPVNDGGLRSHFNTCTVFSDISAIRSMFRLLEQLVNIA